jgi:hypothetical protein
MDFQIKDKVVLITGGAKGIGEAISKACAQEGAIPVAWIVMLPPVTSSKIRFRVMDRQLLSVRICRQPIFAQTAMCNSIAL